MAPRADDFERVNVGSGVIMFHHQPWMPVIGNWVNQSVMLKRFDD